MFFLDLAGVDKHKDLHDLKIVDLHHDQNKQTTPISGGCCCFVSVDLSSMKGNSCR
jgi:hypothetical protein